MPAGDSEQARENRQANQREQEASRPAGASQQAGGRWMPAGNRQANQKSRKPAGASQQVEGGCPQATASQQARERTDKLDRCGSKQTTASRWKPAGGS